MTTLVLKVFVVSRLLSMSGITSKIGHGSFQFWSHALLSDHFHSTQGDLRVDYSNELVSALVNSTLIANRALIVDICFVY